MRPMLALILTLSGCAAVPTPEVPAPADAAAPTDDDLPTSPQAADAYEEPCGIYVLASADLSTNIRDASWVAGYVLRSRWDLLESEGEDGPVYDFSAIDTALEKLEPLGQKLTIQVLGNEPDFVVEDADDTWVWHDPNPRHTGDCSDADGCERVLPWDGPTRTRRKALLAAMAAHKAPYGEGTLALSEHPGVDGVMVTLRGWGRVRELDFEVEDWPDYSREKLVKATLQDIRDEASAFPRASVHLQMWPVRDGEDEETELWEDIQAGVPESVRHRVGYLQENLSHRVDDDGTETFLPGAAAEPLVAIRDDTWTGMQMLTSFARPTPGQERQVSGGSPVEAMSWSWSEHGARYFEIYVADVDAAEDEGWDEDLEDLADDLCP